MRTYLTVSEKMDSFFKKIEVVVNRIKEYINDVMCSLLNMIKKLLGIFKFRKQENSGLKSTEADEDLGSKKAEYSARIKVKTFDNLISKDEIWFDEPKSNKRKNTSKEKGEYVFRKDKNNVMVDCFIDTTMATSPFSVMLDAKPMYILSYSGKIKYLTVDFSHYISIRTKIRPVLKEDNSKFEKNHYYVNDYVLVVAEQMVDVTKIKYKKAPIPSFIEIVTLNENDETVSIRTEVKLVVRMLNQPIFLLTVVNNDTSVLLGSISKINTNVYMVIGMRRSSLTGNVIIMLRLVCNSHSNYRIGDITDGFGDKF